MKNKIILIIALLLVLPLAFTLVEATQNNPYISDLHFNIFQKSFLASLFPSLFSISQQGSGTYNIGDRIFIDFAMDKVPINSKVTALHFFVAKGSGGSFITPYIVDKSYLTNLNSYFANGIITNNNFWLAMDFLAPSQAGTYTAWIVEDYIPSGSTYTYTLREEVIFTVITPPNIPNCLNDVWGCLADSACINGQKTIQICDSITDYLCYPTIASCGSSGGYCGDGIINSGETCSSCPSDVKCASEQTCTSGVCVDGGQPQTCTNGQYKCDTENSVSQCSSGTWGSPFNCLSGQICTVGTISNTNPCHATSLCNNNGSCDSGETITNCPNDCVVSSTKCEGIGRTCRAGGIGWACFSNEIARPELTGCINIIETCCELQDKLICAGTTNQGTCRNACLDTERQVAKLDCGLGATCCSPLSVQNVNGTDVIQASQPSLTWTEWNTASSAMRIKTVCSVDENCEPYEDLSGNNILYVVKCQQTQQVVTQLAEDYKIVCDSSWIKQVGLGLTWLGGSGCLGAISLTAFCAAATGGLCTISAPITIGICSATASIGFATITGCAVFKQQDISKGACIAIPQGSQGGFCFQSATNWFGKLTGSQDCQTNTIVLCVIILIGIILIGKLMR